MILLVLDTSLEACSAAVVEGASVRAAISEPMPRGHQERLALLVDELMTQAGLPFAALDRIGTTLGPGSFTGLRVGIAFAKGLAFALDRPLVGVGTLQALAAGTMGPAAAVIDARRDQVYVQGFEDGVAVAPPEALSVSDAAAHLSALAPRRLIGSGAPLLAPWFPAAELDRRPGPDPAALARLIAAEPEPVEPPRPLYLRAPDAKLPA